MLVVPLLAALPAWLLATDIVYVGLRPGRGLQFRPLLFVHLEVFALLLAEATFVLVHKARTGRWGSGDARPSPRALGDGPPPPHPF